MYYLAEAHSECNQGPREEECAGARPILGPLINYKS